MDYLTELESKSIYVIREAYSRFPDIAMLWSVGKDSTTMVWMARKAFYGKIPFPVIHIDTGYKFPEMYSFRDKYAEEWDLELIVGKNTAAMKNGMGPDVGAKLDCCTALKTEALKMVLTERGYKAIILGIRRDEHGIRAKERYFSPRDEQFQWNYKDQPPELWDQYKSASDDGSHLRIHPLLHMTELEIWEYINRERIPINELYFARNGKRYRSLGCVPCCNPVESEATSIEAIIDELKTTHTAERAGRAQDKEDAYTMQKLRALGYM